MATRSQSDAGADGTDRMNAIATLQQAGFGSMMNMGTAFAEAFGEMGAEFVGFMADRIREDVKTQHQILHCKDVGELQHIQAEFVQKAIEQYQVETGKLIQMSKSVLLNALKESKG